MRASVAARAFGRLHKHLIDCPRCAGTGKVEVDDVTVECPSCHGRTYIGKGVTRSHKKEEQDDR